MVDSSRRPAGARFALVGGTALALLAGCSAGDGQVAEGPLPSAPPPTSPASVPPPAGSAAGHPAAAWPTYHRDNARNGFDAATPPVRTLTRAFATKLDGAVYGQPLVVGTAVIAATENDSIYALDARTGAVRWRTHVGTPVQLSTLPCGNIDPLGITGTAAYDQATGRVFAVAETTGAHHTLVGVDVLTGTVEVRRALEPPIGDRHANQQRSALTVSRGRVYVAYGGLAGDCGNYIGSVVASRTDGTGPLLSWHVPTTREGGIWAPSGAAVDADGNLYYAVGNGESTAGYDGSDSVTRLSPTLRRLGFFAPSDWAAHNAADRDLGSTGPALLPGGLVYVNGKAPVGYLLRARALGGIGGERAKTSTCLSFGGNAVVGSTVIVPCNDGIRAVRVDPAELMSVAWRAPASVTGSPVVGGNTVFALDVERGRLHALKLGTGDDITTVDVGPVPHFASPTLVGKSLYIGTLSGVTRVRIG